MSKTIKSITTRHGLMLFPVGIIFHMGDEPSVENSLEGRFYEGMTIEQAARYLESLAEGLREMDEPAQEPKAVCECLDHHLAAGMICICDKSDPEPPDRTCKGCGEIPSPFNKGECCVLCDYCDKDIKGLDKWTTGKNTLCKKCYDGEME